MSQVPPRRGLSGPKAALWIVLIIAAVVVLVPTICCFALWGSGVIETSSP